MKNLYSNVSYKGFLASMLENHEDAQWSSWNGKWVDDDTLNIESKYISLYYYPKSNQWYIKELKTNITSYKIINSIKGLTGKFLYQLDYVKDRNETITN